METCEVTDSWECRKNLSRDVRRPDFVGASNDELPRPSRSYPRTRLKGPPGSFRESTREFGWSHGPYLDFVTRGFVESGQRQGSPVLRDLLGINGTASAARRPGQSLARRVWLERTALSQPLEELDLAGVVEVVRCNARDQRQG